MSEERKSYSDEELDRILEEYSSIGKSRANSEPKSANPDKKKFVVHIDESIIDSAPSSEPSHLNNNSGGIYFSNYAKNKSKSHTNQSSASGQTGEKNSKPANQRPQQSTATAKQLANKHRKNVKSIGGSAAVGFIVFIMVSTIILSYFGLTCVGDMLAINRSEENIEVVIPPDSTYIDIIDILKDNGLIKRKLFCQVFTKYRGFDDEQYLSGTYYLNNKMGVEGMLVDLMSAPVTADTIKLSFPEGWTIQQIIEKIEKNEVCTSSKLYSALKSASYDSYKFISDIDTDSSRYLKLEGYLFPDTYDFYVDADANYVIRKFLDNFNNKWEAEYDARAKKLGFTRDEIITIASIIQKEAANAEQMKTVSSVLHNRLKDAANYPTLGCDSTAIYVSNYVTPVVGETQGNVLYDNYDTSAIKGLPPGPICNPGMDAIRAALYPEDTNYYFFAHDKSGKIYLAQTLNEHRNNLVKIIQANKNYN